MKIIEKNIKDENWSDPLLPAIGEEIAAVAEELAHAGRELAQEPELPADLSPDTLNQIKQLCDECAQFASATRPRTPDEKPLSWEIIENWRQITQCVLSDLEIETTGPKTAAQCAVLALIRATQALEDECCAALGVKAHSRSDYRFGSRAEYRPTAPLTPPPYSRAGAAPARAPAHRGRDAGSWVRRQEKWDFF